jgi:hypothetical protein
VDVSAAFSAAGAYAVVAKITNSTSTHGSATMTHDVVVRQMFQDDDRRVRYDGWSGVTSTRATGGGYRVASSSMAFAAVPFTASRVTYVARTGPDKGIARVQVDGRAFGRVDLYTAKARRRAVAVSGLRPGKHVIRVEATGAKNVRSTGRAATLDGFVVGGARRDDDSSAVVYDRWHGARSANADGGSARESWTRGASTSLRFKGTSVTWLTVKGPRQGRARIVLDGHRLATVDNYAAARTWHVPRTYGGLSAGAHTIKVMVLGRHSAASAGNRIFSDAFVVQ